MLPVDLMILLERLPYGGRLLVWVPLIITSGAILSTIVPAPLLTSSRVYWILYRALQWCALNVGRAQNITDPVAKVALLTEQMAGGTIVAAPPFPGARTLVAIGTDQRTAAIHAIVDGNAKITDVEIKKDTTP